MPNSFPGMNPYLEKPIQWRGVQRRLMAALYDEIWAQLNAPFFVSVEERLYPEPTQEAFHRGPTRNLQKPLTDSSDIPSSRLDIPSSRLVADPPLHISIPFEEEESIFLKICHVTDIVRVVAIVEVLSPKTKSRESHWRKIYLAAQKRLLKSKSHLLEIDLLREGIYTLAAPYDEVKSHHKEPWHYGICLHRAMAGNRYELWLTTLQERLPNVSLPLLPEHPDLVIDMNSVVSCVYERGHYAQRIQYSEEPIPPLSPEDTQWMDELLKEQGLR